ncbi:hypothetical protein AGRA3207_007346 [Actinomadura graeca]|uniref:XRE family transcriptional regulator n=1 Tax=Actinomadura graeca TaxID=2750812 RepID=A0ABX8R5J3_9ACTN|nr:hypothetical protein [Actinomadura graeca]QXJ25796.1 hypothetical protein AGRA3207_007346 [Actinomadura graeca]
MVAGSAGGDVERDFAALIAELARFRSDRLGREPSDRALAKAAEVSPMTVGGWLRGDRFPQELDKLLRVVRAVGARAGRAGLAPADRARVAALVDPQRWKDAYRAEAARRAQGTRAAVEAGQGRAALEGLRPGRPLSQVTDPFALEVHRPIALEQAGDLPVLPRYVRRAHDRRLAEAVGRAAGGGSVMAVLVAGSSAGKTRACWEALRPLRDRPEQWRLWHPLDPARSQAAAGDLERVGPYTVVWLNETQEYLSGEGGERVAAKLRTLLADPGRAPVLVLGTLWPRHHTDLTRQPGSQVSQVLDGTLIEVPGTFTGADLDALRQAAGDDARLGQAADRAEDGQITQYLAGGPALLERLAAAPPEAKALIWAAMDARRMGHRNALPQALLEEAATAYLTDIEYERLGDDWLEQALAYACEPCKGARGPVTRIRPRRNDRRGRRTAAAPLPGTGPVYRLADYLDQHGRTTRHHQITPIGFWAAAAAHAHPADMGRLGDAAWARGLYRDATQLHKNSTLHGDPAAAYTLIKHLHALNTDDHRPAVHAAAHAPLDDPYAVASLLRGLREVGAGEQVAALVARDPAAHAPLDDPRAVASLLRGLREVGAGEQVAALAGRAAAQVSLDDPDAVASLLYRLRRVGAGEQVAALAGRAAAQVSLDDPYAVIFLLEVLREVGAGEQVAALVARDPAAHALLDDPRAVASLLQGLRRVGAGEQVAALAGRATAQVSLDDPHTIASLLYRLRRVGAGEQVAALVARDPATHAPLDDPDAVARLLQGLREVGAGEQVAALVARDPATQVSLDNPDAVAFLLRGLRRVGAGEQVAALVARDPATQVSLYDPRAVASLLRGLREVGAGEQVVALAGRAAAQVSLDNPRAVASLLQGLRRVGAGEQVVALAGRAAAQVSLDNPDAVASLLQGLRRVGAGEQVVALAGRAAAQVSLDNPDAVASLLQGLREVGAGEQVAALVARDPAAQVSLDSPDAVIYLLQGLREVGAGEQVAALAGRAAAHAPLDNPDAVASLLEMLRGVGAGEQVTALVARDPAAQVPLDDPRAVASLLEMLRGVGAGEQVTALVARDPAAQVPLDDPRAVASLLEMLRRVGADEQVAALTDLLPAAGLFEGFLEVGDRRVRYRFGRESDDGRPAEPWGWEDLE